MSQPFKTQALSLLNNGYLIVPIKQGEKRPAIKGWLNSRVTPNELDLFMHCGVGVLCGQGKYPLMGFDIDTTLAPLAHAFLNWCQSELGATCVRVGNAPKLLMVYRTTQLGVKKITGEWFKDAQNERHRLEILGYGQQFVAYHIHPVTKQPYQWTDAWGGLEHCSAFDLPLVTPSQIKGAVQQFDELAESHELTRVNKSPVFKKSAKRSTTQQQSQTVPPMTRSSLELREARKLLGMIESEDYEKWLKVGMCLHFEFKGAQEALKLWDEWSQGAVNYHSFKDLQQRWRGFKSNGAHLVTFQWLKKIAHPKRYADTELGNALRMVDQRKEKIIYVPELRRWYQWTGVYWKKALRVTIEQLAKKTILALPHEAKQIQNDKERMEFLRFCALSQKSIMVKSMIELASSDEQLVVSVGELDRHSHLLGVANGAVNLHTGALLPPDPQLRITMTTQARYDPSAKALLFERTVADVFFENQEMILFFQRLIGYTLMGNPIEGVMPILFGSGANGKSTVLNAIRYVLGDYATGVSAHTFIASSERGAGSSAALPEILSLRGKRFVYVDEPDSGGELREGIIKSMTGGDLINARALYSNTVVAVTPTWVAFMPTNHLPIVKGVDYAIWRRLLTIPFIRNFDKDPTHIKDLKRGEKLKGEASGILAWCIRGAFAYQSHGLKPPLNVQQTLEAYRAEMDLLTDWIKECCEVNPHYTESNAVLWKSWECFATERGELHYAPNPKSLGRKLTAKGFEAVKNRNGIRGRAMKGIRVVKSE